MLHIVYILFYILFCNFQNSTHKIYLLILNQWKEAVNLGARNCITPACKGPSLINHGLSGSSMFYTTVSARTKETGS